MNSQWYKELVVYQIWPRSFYDSNADGIGDIQGIIQKLDYIKSIGANAIWLSPIYKSPQKDYGYDISDYMSIAPEYGTMDDFKELLSTAHKKELKLIMDLVINHTSDQHEWFKKSRESKDNPYHDYYFWRSGKEGNKPPNNWLATFPGPGWEYDGNLDEYYLHLFAVEQPDLNMDNPKVRQEIKDILKFWLDMGVDGFREDVITYISKVQGLPDGKGVIPIVRGKENYICGPNLKKYLREFKEVLNKYDCMTVGEAPMMTPDIALEFIEETPDQLLNMMFHFEHMEADSYVTSWIKLPFNLVKLKKAFSVWQEKLYGRAWNALYIENHDQPRIVNRYGSLKFRKESAKMLATMYICQRGTPFIYQGQEIGMTNIELPQLNMYEDISTINTYKLLKKFKVPQKMIINMAKYASRDNARTPVQWTDGRNAGFTAAQKPWFYINENYKYINVQEEENNKNSVLNYYRELLKIRSQNPVFIYGDYREHFPESKEIYSYERNYQGEKLLIICSFSDHVVEFQSPYNLSKAKRLIGNYKPRMNTGHMLLRPYECVVYSI